MKRTTSGLRRARRLYRRRKFAQLINFLEPQVFMFRQSFEYYYLLGYACLRTGDYAGSFSFLQRAADLDPHNAHIQLAIAVVQLRRARIDDAIRTYLGILDQHPNNGHARRGLTWLRRIDSPDEVVDWFETKRIQRLLPAIGLFVPDFVWVLVAISAGAALLWTAIAVAPRVLAGRQPLRDGIEYSRAPAGALIDPALRTVRFTFTERELQSQLSRIGDYFQAGRDNLVRRELNRMALSNADEAVRSRVQLIWAYLREPDFTTFADGFEYPEAAADPALYDRVYVRWQGRVANLRIGDDAIRFDFLVGYHDGRVLQGVVPSRIGFAVLLRDDMPIEVIGQLERITAAPVGANPFHLQVTGVRMLAPTAR